MQVEPVRKSPSRRVHIATTFPCTRLDTALAAMAGHTGADGAGGRVAAVPAAVDGPMRELGQTRTTVPPVPRPGVTGKRSRGGVSATAAGATGAPAAPAVSSPSGRDDDFEEEDDEEEENYVAGPQYGPDGRVRWAVEAPFVVVVRGHRVSVAADEVDPLSPLTAVYGH